MNHSSIFTKELNLIVNTDLKNIVIDILDNYVNQDNFKKPSSSSNKYHPYFDNIEYGNSNHTKAVVKLCNTLLVSRIDLSNEWSDKIYASAILHDMWKYDGISNHTNSNHDELAYFELKKYAEEHHNNDLMDIAIIIRYHMGHWNWEENQWISNLRQIQNECLYDAILIVHYADMIASRKWYDVKEFTI